MMTHLTPEVSWTAVKGQRSSACLRCATSSNAAPFLPLCGKCQPVPSSTVPTGRGGGATKARQDALGHTGVMVMN